MALCADDDPDCRIDRAAYHCGMCSALAHIVFVVALMVQSSWLLTALARRDRDAKNPTLGPACCSAVACTTVSCTVTILIESASPAAQPP